MGLDSDIEYCHQIHATLLLGYDTRSLRKSFLTFQETYWTQLQVYKCERRFYSDMITGESKVFPLQVRCGPEGG